MGKVIDLSHGIHVSMTAFASEFGSTRETISKRIAAARLQPTGKRGGHPVYRLGELHEAVYQAGEDGGTDPDKLEPFQRKAHYQAEHEKLRLQVERLELVPRIEVEEEMARIAKIVAQCFDTLPDRLERDCGVTPLVLAKIERYLDEVREELHKAAVRQDAEDDADSAIL